MIKTKLGFILVFLFCCLFTASSYGADKEAIKHNNLGKKYLDDGNYELALNEFNIAIKLDPKYIEAIKNRGNVYYYQGQLDEALKDYTLIISIDPTVWNAYNNIGNVYWDRGNSPESLKYYEKAIEMSPSSWEPYSNAGLVYLDMKEYEKAAKYFHKVLKIDPKNAQAYGDLGYAQYKLNKVEEAVKNLNQSISLNPDDSVSYFDLGTIYSDKAVIYNKKIADNTAKDEDIKAAYNLYQESLKNYQKAVEIEPKNPRYRYCLGLAYFALTEDDKALAQYKIAMDDARNQGDDNTIKLIQDQIKVIQDLKAKKQQQGGNK